MVKYIKLSFFVIIIIVCGLGFIFYNKHPHFIWQKVPVFEAIFGFLGCLLFILIAKTLGKLFLQKKEDYYDD